MTWTRLLLHHSALFYLTSPTQQALPPRDVSQNTTERRQQRCGFLIWPSQCNSQLLLTALMTSAVSLLPCKHPLALAQRKVTTSRSATCSEIELKKSPQAFLQVWRQTTATAVVWKKKLKPHASRKWVKPFPLRGGFPGSDTECGLSPEFTRSLPSLSSLPISVLFYPSIPDHILGDSFRGFRDSNFSIFFVWCFSFFVCVSWVDCWCQSSVNRLPFPFLPISTGIRQTFTQWQFLNSLPSLNTNNSKQDY